MIYCAQIFIIVENFQNIQEFLQFIAQLCALKCAQIGHIGHIIYCAQLFIIVENFQNILDVRCKDCLCINNFCLVSIHLSQYSPHFNVLFSLSPGILYIIMYSWILVSTFWRGSVSILVLLLRLKLFYFNLHN